MSEQGLGDGPVENVTEILGGTQNIMLRFTHAGREYVFRRGPKHLRPVSNKVILRETRVLHALADTDVPHPRLIAVCDDTAVLGDAVFYLMEPVDGFNAGCRPAGPARRGRRHPPRHGPVDGRRGGPARRRRPRRSRAGRLRQTRRDSWNAKCHAGFRSWSPTAASITTPAPTSGTSTRSPPGCSRTSRLSGRPGIMHGDYHAANVMFSPTGPEVVAIVDWEMCTIGDPLLDLGWMLATWYAPGHDSVLTNVLMDAGDLGHPGRARRAIRAEHHPRPVQHPLVHGDGLLQAGNHPGGLQRPGRCGPGAQGDRRTGCTSRRSGCSSGHWH